MFYEPKNGHGLPHDPFKAIVAPRPIGWISTRNRAGEVNLAPYSFFNAFSTSPFLVWFASGGVKDGPLLLALTNLDAEEPVEITVDLRGGTIGEPTARLLTADRLRAPTSRTRGRPAPFEALTVTFLTVPAPQA